MRKYILIFLTFFFTLCISAYATEIVETGSCGDNITYTLNSEGILIFSGSGNMVNYSPAGSPFLQNTDIKKVIIENGITNIGNGIFRGCTELAEIEIPDSVVSIGNHSFRDCSKLNNVSIPSSVTSIGSSAFYDCFSLIDVYYKGTLNEWDEVLYEESYVDCAVIHCADGNANACTALEEDFDFVNGIIVNYKGTDKIVVVPEIIGGTAVEKIADKVFSDNYDVYQLILPDTISSIGKAAFENCANLRKIVLPKKLKTISDDTFWFCERLTSVEIPDGVLGIGGRAFGGCHSLTEIVIPESVLEIDSSAFAECYGIKRIIIGSGVKTISSLCFRECKALEMIYLPDNIEKIWNNAFSDCLSLTEISLPQISEIDDETFYNCYYLKNIYIPKTVKSISENAFYGCYSLDTIYFSGTEKEWNEITVSDGNDYLVGADVVFNSTSITGLLLKYNANGGIANIPCEIFKNGDEITISDVVPVRDRFEFLGWASSNEATVAEYGPEETINCDSSLTLYAVWKEIPYVTTTTVNVISGHVILFIQADSTITTDKMLHIALYSENNRLVDYIVVPSVEEFKETNVVFKDDENIKYAKIFLWNSSDNITPISLFEQVTIR